MALEPPQQLHDESVRSLSQAVPPALFAVDERQAPQEVLRELQKNLRVQVVE